MRMSSNRLHMPSYEHLLISTMQAWYIQVSPSHPSIENHDLLTVPAIDLTIHSYLCGPPVDRVTENFITSRRGQRPLDLNIGKYPTIYSVCETGPGKDLPFTRYLPITVLGDLHDAVFGRTEYTKRIQHPLYRAPEVARKQPWTSKADIWNVGALVRGILSTVCSRWAALT